MKQHKDIAAGRKKGCKSLWQPHIQSHQGWISPFYWDFIAVLQQKYWVLVNHYTSKIFIATSVQILLFGRDSFLPFSLCIPSTHHILASLCASLAFVGGHQTFSAPADYRLNAKSCCPAQGTSTVWFVTLAFQHDKRDSVTKMVNCIWVSTVSTQNPLHVGALWLYLMLLHHILSYYFWYFPKVVLWQAGPKGCREAAAVVWKPQRYLLDPGKRNYQR